MLGVSIAAPLALAPGQGAVALSCTMAATTGSLRIRSVGAHAALPGQLHLLAHAGKCNLFPLRTSNETLRQPMWQSLLHYCQPPLAGALHFRTLGKHSRHGCLALIARRIKQQTKGCSSISLLLLFWHALVIMQPCGCR